MTLFFRYSVFIVFMAMGLVYSAPILFETTEQKNQQRQSEEQSLSEAIYNGDLAKVVELYAKSNRIEGKNSQQLSSIGSSVVCLATYFGDTSIVISLLDYGMPVNEIDQQGNTPLIWASALGNHELVALLLKRQADIHTKNKYGLTALDISLKKGQSRVAFLLVDHLIALEAQRGWKPLPWCIKEGHYNLIRLLLNAPLPQVKVDETDGAGNTALILAVKQRRLDMVKTLLAKGASVLLSNRYGETALSIALASSDHEMIYMLAQQAAGMDDANRVGYGVLSWAVRSGDIFIVRSILKKEKIQVDAQDRLGNTPLYWAVNEGYHSIARLLIQMGGDANKKNNHGVSPVALAAQKGDTQMLALFAEQQTALQDTNKYGWTVLITAARYGHTASVKELLEQNVEVDEEDDAQNTALYWACRYGHVQIVRLLLEHGANVHKKNVYGWTPLYWAVRNKHARVVRLLLNYCASESHVNSDLFMAYCKVTRAIKQLLVT